MAIPRKDGRVKPYEVLAERVLSAFRRVEAELALISDIDRSILQLDGPLDSMLLRICHQLEQVVDVRDIDVVFVTSQSIRSVGGFAADPAVCGALLERVGEFAALGPGDWFELRSGGRKSKEILLAVPLVVKGVPFAIMILSCEAGKWDPTATEYKPFVEMVLTQLGLLVERYLSERRTQLESGLSRTFFDSKLKPSACYREIVGQIAAFLPDWRPFGLFPAPKVQLLSYSEGDTTLRIVGTVGTEMVGTEVAVDSSICGLLIEDRTLDYVRVNPVEHSHRYRGFLLGAEASIPQSELAVPIRLDGQIIGVLNLEHPEPNAFATQHILASLSATEFLAPFLAALRERHERQRSKEVGILYTLSHLLIRTASMYQHLLGQPLLDARLKLERLEKKIPEDLSDVMLLVKDISSAVDRIALSSKRFSESLPAFMDNAAIEVSPAITKALSVMNTRRLEDEEKIQIDVSRVEAASGSVWASQLLAEHIYNLVNNSLYSVRQAMNLGLIDRGRIEIGAIPQVVTDALGGPTASRIVVFRIRDNGTGVNPEDEQKIGRSGFTTKKGYGSGYGLAAALEYMQSLRGDLQWYNLYPNGFEVKFYLEAYDDKKH
jgi:signal transduction histidine kinase